jgi:hypothetical protein
MEVGMVLQGLAPGMEDGGHKQPFADRSLNGSPIEHPLANQVLSKESQVILSTQDFANWRISPSGQSYG